MNFDLKIIEYFTNWTKQKIRIHHTDISELYFREREVWWASIGANVGFEQNGKHESYERPIVILKKFNKEVLWVLPMTSREKTGKYYFESKYNGEKSFVVLSQLRVISSRRLLRKIRVMEEAQFEELRKLVKDLI